MAARGTLDEWQRLLAPTSETLRNDAAAIAEPSAADIAKLRRHHDAALVPLALELADARRRAESKYGPRARDLAADRAGVEQSTSAAVADWKARRIAELAPTTILDLCCGIGGDAMSLARVGTVRAIDRDPVRAWMCSVNAGCITEAADVTSAEIPGECVVHIDPARRDESTGRRRHQLADLMPPIDFTLSFARAGRDAAVKLGPGAPLGELDLDGCEVEVIGEPHGLVQTVVWSGRLAHHAGQRTATALPTGRTFSAMPSPLRHSDVTGAALYVAHPAIERAELTAACTAGSELGELHPGLGILTGPLLEHPWLTSYEVIEEMPWREARVREALRAHDAGVVTVRTRDRAVNPDLAARRLRGDGSVPLDLFVLRCGTAIRAFITRPG